MAVGGRTRPSAWPYPTMPIVLSSSISAITSSFERRPPAYFSSRTDVDEGIEIRLIAEHRHHPRLSVRQPIEESLQ